MSAAAKANQTAQSAIQGLMAWVSLAIGIVEKIALAGLVFILFGNVAAKFGFSSAYIPNVSAQEFAMWCLGWALLKGRLDQLLKQVFSD